MKKLFTLCFFTLIITNVYADNTAPKKSDKFNFSGLNPNTVVKSCQHEPCSLAKVMHVETKQQDQNSATVLLTLLGGTQEHYNQKITWNDQPHQVAIHCSISKPRIEIFDQVMPVYFMPHEPDMPSDVTLYLKSCHNLSHSKFEELTFLGYPLTTFITP